jgi:hypothetical protein
MSQMSWRVNKKRVQTTVVTTRKAKTEGRKHNFKEKNKKEKPCKKTENKNIVKGNCTQTVRFGPLRRTRVKNRTTARNRNVK